MIFSLKAKSHEPAFEAEKRAGSPKAKDVFFHQNKVKKSVQKFAAESSIISKFWWSARRVLKQSLFYFALALRSAKHLDRH